MKFSVIRENNNHVKDIFKYELQTTNKPSFPSGFGWINSSQSNFYRSKKYAIIRPVKNIEQCPIGIDLEVQLPNMLTPNGHRFKCPFIH